MFISSVRAFSFITGPLFLCPWVCPLSQHVVASNENQMTKKQKKIILTKISYTSLARLAYLIFELASML